MFSNELTIEMIQMVWILTFKWHDLKAHLKIDFDWVYYAPRDGFTDNSFNGS